ncbi:MAG: hypothetical protein KKE02_00960 [Alphaproteobacteria bacterium]|nr:hypothetical protein [Alphaproteobacteria bacterium]MBU1515759.1 hypothetical protein [Alphaproteobacteria bacterium]MBU2097042.1 hypothetical protein [Alphaproteobacteria bacterium]MBU2149558.1 hypothetical protein [Alphaproteobacteria bacterium]MBU2308944.1 hypothetical protein [Alphaproteobacteria bacterium]
MPPEQSPRQPSAGQQSYVAVDVAADGSTTLDTFTAPHDSAASRRALIAADGVAVALWRGELLVGRWRRAGGRGFKPAPRDED